MTGYRKILLWAFHGFILSGVFTSYSHAADVNLTHFFTNDRKLRAELSSEDLLGFELPKGTGLGKMPGAEISEDKTLLAKDYTLTLKLSQAPTGTYTVKKLLEGEAQNGRRYRLPKDIPFGYQLAGTRELLYEVQVPKDTPLNKKASTDPTEYDLAAKTNCMVKPPKNGIVTLTVQALTRVKMIPGSAFLGTTVEVEQSRAPVNGYITPTIANNDFNFSKAKFDIGIRVQDFDSDKSLESFAACDAVELIELPSGKAILKARIPELSTLKGIFLAKPVDLLVIARGPDNSIAEAVFRNFKVSSRQSATLWWIIAALAPWALAAFIATRRAIEKEGGQATGDQTGKVRRIDPIWFVAGKYGNASLSLAQILLWTFLVFSASFYVLIASGKLLDLTTDVLILLGITGGSSVIAKISAAVKTEKGRDIFEVMPKNPQWQDLVQTEGRPDLYKFQMLMFTALAALFVVFKIAGTFEFPELPAGLLTLIGISNGVYLAAKTASPSEFEKLAEADRKLQVALQKVASCKKIVEEKQNQKTKVEGEIKAAEDKLKQPLDNAEKEQLNQLLATKKLAMEKIIEDKTKADTELTNAETEKAELEKLFNKQKSKIIKQG